MELGFKGFFTKSRLIYTGLFAAALYILFSYSTPAQLTFSNTVLRGIAVFVILYCGFYLAKHPIPKLSGVKSFRLYPVISVFGDQKITKIQLAMNFLMTFAVIVILSSPRVHIDEWKLYLTLVGILCAFYAGHFWYKTSPHSFWGLAHKNT